MSPPSPPSPARPSPRVRRPARGRTAVLFVTSECAPWVKTGGLADVSASLPAALRAADHDVRVLMPAYASVTARLPTREIARAQIHGLQVQGLHVRLLEAQDPAANEASVPLWLLDIPGLFDRPGSPYADPNGREWQDNGWRFGCFCAAAAWVARGATLRHPEPRLRFLPDVVHANDWPAGLVGAWLVDERPRPALVFGIHNLAYQGCFDRGLFDALRLPGHLWHMDGVEFHGALSFLKAGLTCADEIVTVSPGYAREITMPAHGYGMDGVLRGRAEHLHGIVNGIDIAEWDPATDPHIPQRFDSAQLDARRANTAALRAECGLPPSDEPLLAMVSRLAWQKGSDIVLDALPELLALGLQLVMLGNGDAALAAAWRAAADAHPGQVSFTDGYDEALAHRIEAGADVFLMPSRYEPCGLNQLYSLRYGCLPLVHATGGLLDTVRPLQLRNGRLSGTGFHFTQPDSLSLLCAVQEMLSLWQQPELWRVAQRNGMAHDASWAASIPAYGKVYEMAIGRAAARGRPTGPAS